MKTIAILGAMLVTGAAAAEQPASAPTVHRGADGDPDRIICRTEREIGSRLATRRVCRTRAEWAEHRAQTRDRLERAQQQMQTSY
ncbi:MAG: hypothetical protein M3177_07600 [Pseudomonadota bacterium]|nr:hypothetical protein [Pseudomonadota bacterium]